MSKNVLTKEQREKLKERHKTERDGRIRDRIKAVFVNCNELLTHQTIVKN